MVRQYVYSREGIMRKLFVVLICFIVVPAWASPQGLLGKWQCQDEEGATVLDFMDRQQLVYDGETNNYRLQGDAIMIQGLFGEEVYRYKLAGKKLAVTFPDGSRINCVRAGEVARSSNASESTARNGNAYLRGRLCRWSGSSSSYSGTSYSSSATISFDGQGNAMYGGSETSFSSNDGMAYASGGGGTRGSYQVRGNEVRIQLEDGTEILAEVNMRQNDGRITELMANGKLWATGLCE